MGKGTLWYKSSIFFQRSKRPYFSKGYAKIETKKKCCECLVLKTHRVLVCIEACGLKFLRM